MLIKQLKVSGLLSFGPIGIDLPLGNLNVLIGPNGSGKSNLLEVLALLKAAPKSLPAPVKEMGGVREWLWKGAGSPPEATVQAIVNYSHGKKQPLRHGLCVAEHGGRFEVVDEWIENEKPLVNQLKPYIFYRFQRGNPVLNVFQPEAERRSLKRENVKPEQSILSQVRDPEKYPELAWLQQRYEQIRLFRNWSFGPGALLRREQSTLGSNDFLEDGGENLALVLSRIRSGDLIRSLKTLYDGIDDLSFNIQTGGIQLCVDEKGGGRRKIPATRLSDGTLRYLCLLAILLHPEPPPLVVIEEPELGLHPDVIPHLAELLTEASQRTQLVVTTHSRMLVDALSDQPESVVVCAKEEGESRMDRLNSADLKEWLEKYSLGDLWSKGEIGGNRW